MRTIALWCLWLLTVAVALVVVGCSSAEETIVSTTEQQQQVEEEPTTALPDADGPSCAPDTDGIRVAADVDGDEVDDDVLVAVGPDGSSVLLVCTIEAAAFNLDSSSEATWQRFPAGQEDGPPEAEGTFDVASKRGTVEVLMNGTCGDDVVIDLATLR